MFPPKNYIHAQLIVNIVNGQSNHLVKCPKWQSDYVLICNSLVP